MLFAPRPIGRDRDIGADEYGTRPPAAVTDLLASRAVTGTGTLTATLRWSPAAGAITATLRYAGALITENNWASAFALSVLPGDTDTFTATVPYHDKTVYFALKSQNIEGEWSTLSNNAFWPHFYVYLPLLVR